MEPILFPFTYLPESVLEAVSGCFERFAVYLPSELHIPEAMKTREGKGLTLRIPIRGDEAQIAGILKEYRYWTDLHGRDGVSRLKTQTGAVPFFDETAPSRIREEIRRIPGQDERRGAERKDYSADSLLKARLFLHAAQELDRQNTELLAGLARVDQKERLLYETLRGEMEPTEAGGTASGPDGPGALPDEPGSHMTRERLAAWGNLCLNDPEEAGFFVTPSPSVFDIVLDEAGETESILFTDAIPSTRSRDGDATAWRSALNEQLKAISLGNATPAAKTAADLPRLTHVTGSSLKIHRIPGISPSDLFSRFSFPASGKGRPVGSAAGFCDTFVGLLIPDS